MLSTHKELQRLMERFVYIKALLSFWLAATFYCYFIKSIA